MKLYRIIAVAMLLALQACDEEDSSDPQTYLTVTVDPKYSYFDMWLFTTDDSGKILETHNASVGSTTIFKIPSPPEFVHLTVFFSIGSQYSFQTYGALKRGTQLTFKHGDGLLFYSGGDNFIGSAEIKIENCAPYARFNISDGSNLLWFSDAGVGALDAPFGLITDKSDILITSFNSTVPVYTWLKDVVANETYDVDFNSLVEFPKTVSFPLTGEMSASIQAIKAGSKRVGYMMANADYSTPPGSLERATIGYTDVDDYDSFLLRVNRFIKTETQYYYNQYQKIGKSLPTEVTLNDNQSFSVKNESFNDFDFTYSSNYSYRTHRWNNYKNENNTSWTVYTSDHVTPRIPELPSELKSKYPSIPLDELILAESSFIKFMGDYNYAKLVDDVVSNNRPSNREQFVHLYFPD